MSQITRNSILVLRNPSFSLVRCLSTVEASTQRKAMLDRMIRVDHAGEYGADRFDSVIA